MDATTRPKAPKNLTSPNAAFEMPKFEMPAAIRDLAEKGGAQAKENSEKMKAANDKMTGIVEATYATAARGATDYGLKVIDSLVPLVKGMSPPDDLDRLSPAELKSLERRPLAMVCFFLETGRFSKKNREAIKHEPGNRQEGSGV